MTSRALLDTATRHLDAPVAVVDLAAFDGNARDLVRRAAGTPIRVASKSVRCRALIRRTLAMPGFHGVLALCLAEALWLAEDIEDVVVGYPTTSRAALATLAGDARLAARVTLMIDSVDHLDLIDAVAPPGERHEIRVCLDLDASLRTLGERVHIGPRRSPVHDVAQASDLARHVVDREGFRLVGLMAYEGQIAGLADRPAGKPLQVPVLRALKSMSVKELAVRRAEVVREVSAITPLEFVNGGGTGSIETTAAESAVTEIAAGSGLYAPALFDGYTSFTPTPAAYFGLDVTRRPAPGMVTLGGGGWIASGPVGKDRQPTIALPEGLSLIGTEGAGEAQTPVKGAAAESLKIGDRVWLRHAKAGELCERVDTLHLLEGSTIVDSVPTYRGEGRTFL